MVCIKALRKHSNTRYRRLKPMRKDSGFTFFELMFIMAIVAILASIAVPNLVGWLPNYRMRSASQELISILRLAKIRAVRENANVVVAFDFTNDSYMAFVDNGAAAGNGLREADELILKNVQLPAGIDLQNAGLGARVAFNRRGFPDTGGNIIVTNGARTQTLSLTLAGSASM